MKRFLAIALLISAMVLVGDKSASTDILKDLGNLLNKPGEDIAKIIPLMMKDNDIGLLFARGVEKQYGLDQNPERNTKVQQLGSNILSANKIAGKYDFAVLASRDFNACSVFGGHIRINEGLLTDTQNNNAETAFVIAHEIAHNELGHNKEAVKNFKIIQVLELTNISKNMPKLLTLGANAVLAKRSRANESAADLQGIKYMTQAGYKITGAIAMARRIEAEHTIAQKQAGNNLVTQRFNTIFDTHPEPAKRAAMAEDELFLQKYGSTFNDMADTNTFSQPPVKVSLTGNSPVVIAHHGQWNTVCRTPEHANAFGFFNPLSILKEKAEFKTYCDWLNKGCALAITCDNDSHYPTAVTTDYGFTYIDNPDNKSETLMQAIKDGRTYASADGINIINENFHLDRQYTPTDKVILTFALDLPKSVLLAPKVQIIRNGEIVATLEKTNSKLERRPQYRFEDKPKTGKYWYVLYIPSGLLTSPITFDVRNGVATATNEPATWQKGLVHVHSKYSDGTSNIGQIWKECQAANLDFVFMTDHLENFTDAKEYDRYVNDCKAQSTAMIPGIEYYLLNDAKLFRHLLVLGLYNYIPYIEMTEEQFFGGTKIDKTLIIKGPFHLGDDVANSEIEKDAVFQFDKVNATIKIRIKGSPFKDPILWINRHEIGRVVTTDNKWHWFEFPVPADILNDGQNLFQIESFIPNRWNTFDDCEVADIYIYPL